MNTLRAEIATARPETVVANAKNISDWATRSRCMVGETDAMSGPETSTPPNRECHESPAVDEAEEIVRPAPKGVEDRIKSLSITEPRLVQPVFTCEGRRTVGWLSFILS